mmetsp:Transcript_24205/g.35196  ORF Transcript_24205/g.35196 Transcript_24205/m.35196 type:complete len:569 (-) Transcript_24205:94-1800(-)|eukprot:CAMPEP_0113943306 /NCGR_PEP_ID=MMETSP1339-20121228/23174_1 /TAXON_ID=94617 /ORGANISM="Fibrocapsa japonica" /LENGTH=568 /DNA_ID=CAMNT_0000948147 /DNA_START=25 /DNA_END=1731 /DNA_ORIENTATION=+ /assembly_acc=CAM_ASM_000762
MVKFSVFSKKNAIVPTDKEEVSGRRRSSIGSRLIKLSTRAIAGSIRTVHEKPLEVDGSRLSEHTLEIDNSCCQSLALESDFNETLQEQFQGTQESVRGNVLNLDGWESGLNAPYSVPPSQLTTILPNSFALLQHCKVTQRGMLPWTKSLKKNSHLETPDLFEIRAKVLLQFECSLSIPSPRLACCMNLSKCNVAETAEGYFCILGQNDSTSLVLAPQDIETRNVWAAALSKAARQVKLSRYTPMSVIGAGRWGTVFVARNSVQPEKLFAVKEITLSKNVALKHLIQERIAMEQVPRHNFVMKMQESVRLGDCLYISMEFMPGGDLFTFLNHHTASSRLCVLYAAEVLLALEHLHSHNTIYRDLKPENILVGPTGHLKLADLGLAKLLDGDNGTTRTLCGTPMYCAPEMIRDVPYGKSVDLWQYGCFLYELFVGMAPFWKPQNERENVHTDIMEGKYHEFPETVSEPVVTTVTLLLETDVKKRLGCGIDGWNAVKNQMIFHKLKSWNSDEIYAKPIVHIDANIQTLLEKNFDASFTSRQPKWNTAKNQPVEAHELELLGFEYEEGILGH